MEMGVRNKIGIAFCKKCNSKGVAFEILLNGNIKRRVESDKCTCIEPIWYYIKFSEMNEVSP